jgi:uncharacterized membrane protein
MRFLFFRFQKILIHVRSSLWFVPTLLSLGAVLLAAVLIEIDIRYYEAIRDRLPELLITQAEGARGMLTAIATSMATVAGVVFSITIVALTLASSQYSPRVLRNFMRDRTNQIVLGVFVGVYIYCLLVLKTISSGQDAFIPSLAILGGLLSAIAAIGFFIYFIHHISTAIQASEIAANVAQETLATIDRLFPEKEENSHADKEALDLLREKAGQCVPSSGLGYIQHVDVKALIAFACKRNTVIRMENGIGNFVGLGRPLVSIMQDHPLDDRSVEEINQMFAIGTYRTIEQDIAFGIRQLVDISLKALSPSLNDTTTAVTCIEHLTVVLSRCAERPMPSPYYYEKGKLRLIVQQISFEDLVSLSYRQILDSASSNTELVAQLFRSLERVAHSTSTPSHLIALKSWVAIIEEVSRECIRSPHAQRRIQEHYRNAEVAFEADRRADNRVP